MSAAEISASYFTCGVCHQMKRFNAFTTEEIKRKDDGPRTCRACEGDAKRAENRERVAQEAGPKMSTTVRSAKASEPAPSVPPTPIRPMAQPAAQAAQQTDILRPAGAFLEAPLSSLVRLLPSEKRWTAAQRKRWLRAFVASLDLLYEVEGGEE